MKETIIAVRNKILRVLYKGIVKKIFFCIDPEKIHDLMVLKGRFLGSNFLTRNLVSLFFSYSNKKLKQTIAGINFSNPIGLAAGFDKNAELTKILPSVGFGFAELGSITGHPCQGNPKPRVWRLKKSQSLVIYYGLKNEGCEMISKKLKGRKFKIPMGISVARTNSSDTVGVAEGITDYLKAHRAFSGIGDYETINISCPNAFGGEDFTDPNSLHKLLLQIDKTKNSKPVFLKISPDLKNKEIDEIIKVADKHKIAGFICTNLTKSRDNKKILDENVPEKGGISGKVVEDLANEMISYVYKKTQGKYIIIGCGGISSAEDAYKKIKSGASLVQLITGAIFEGPQLMSEINQGLVRLIEEDGYNNISDAIGVDVK